MLILRASGGTSDLLKVVTGASGDLRVTLNVMQADASTPPVVQPIPNFGPIAAITTTTTTTLIDSSGLTSGHAYNIKGGVWYNAHASVSVPVTIQVTDGTNTSQQWNGTLAPSESVVLDESGAWTPYSAAGQPKLAALPLTTKGDLVGQDTSTVRIPAGADGTVPIYVAGATAGIRPGAPVPINFSTSTVSASYASDTYLVGSSINMTTNGPVAGTVYYCVFDMVKTAAGTAQFTVNLRFGTAGSTADTSLISWAFGAGTAAADTGQFVVEAHFRTVGSGTSAVVVGKISCLHQLASTGLTNTGTAGYAQITTVSSGFNSTTASSVLGLSVNGGASFSGTNTIVEARAFNLF